MATFTVTTSVNMDTLTSKAGDDTYNINGTAAQVTQDGDTRYGLNQNTSAVLGNVNPSSTLGGIFKIDATKVRLIPYDTGSGNVPADGTAITQGGASGVLIGVYDTLAVAPTAAGAAMPANGFIKIKQWNSTPYAAGALTGLTANATGADVVGWIEVVGQESRSLTINRLNNTATPVITGDYYEIGTTGGNRTDVYQIPSNGVAQYHAGVEVETGTGTGIYEHYGCAGATTALIANIATDSVRGRWCWIATDGTLRFGHDGTNLTGGYLPPAGRKIRIANVFLASATSAAKTANTAPNTTVTTRYRFATSVVGRLYLDHTSCSWYVGLTTPLTANITDSHIMTRIDYARPTNEIILDNVLMGDYTSSGQTESILLSVCPAGMTMTDCTITRPGYSGTFRQMSLQVVAGVTVTNCSFITAGQHTSTNQASLIMNNCVDVNFENSVFGSGTILITSCRDVTMDTQVCFMTTAPGTALTNTVNLFTVTSTDNLLIDGLTFGGFANAVPRTSLVSLVTAPTNCVFRNWGTETSPLDLGNTAVAGASWARVTTTATVTSVAHGLLVNDTVYVYICSNTAPIALGIKTVASTPTADTFTFTATNTGGTSGTLSYYPTYCPVITAISNGTGATGIKFQNIHTKGSSGALYTINANDSDIVFENVSGDLRIVPGTPAPRGFQNIQRSLKGSFYQSITTSILGTHFADGFVQPQVSGGTGKAWTRATTTATVTSVAHGLYSGAQIYVSSSSDTAAIVDGQPTASITVLTEDTFTFPCLNAGGASGTLDWAAYDGRLGIYMNEPTAETASQITVNSGTPSFNGFGSLVMFTTGDQITFETPAYILGYDTFPNFPLQPIGVGLTTYNTYDFAYALDTGAGYGSFKNLAYPRTGAGGSAASTNVTMTSTTGVNVGDYVYGTGIASGAKVNSITNSTTIVVSIANTKAVTGTLVFNQLPNETIGADGFKMKVRITTNATATQTIPTISVPVQSDATSRGTLYSQASQYTLTLSGLVSGSDVVIRTHGAPGTHLVNVDANSGSTYAYTYYYSAGTAVDIEVYKAGYKNYEVNNYTLLESSTTLPIAQEIDTEYV